MLDDLFAQIKPSTLILTANKRLAGWVKHQHHDAQTLRGISTWLSLDVLSFSAWLKRCFIELQTKAYGKPQILLNPQQTSLLWQTIIKNQTDNTLLSINSTATAAQQAWELLQKHNISLDDPQILHFDNNICWKNWAETFVRECENNNWIDPSSLIKLIILELDNLNKPKHIILVGFLEITPAEQLLLNKLNCDVIHYQTHSRNKSIKRATLSNTEDEIYAMATWAKQQNSNNIGCIIPSLNAIYNDIKRIFSEVFADNKKFNISYGDKFSNTPIIYTALEVLSLNTGKIHINDIGYLLRSPFIGGFEDLPKRSLFDIQLRQTNKTEFSLNQLDCDLLKQLQAIKFKKHLTPRAWADIFSKQLSAIGWPGTRSLSKKESKAIERWHILLQEFAALSLIKNSLTCTQALSTLKHLALQTLFQIKKPHATIHILGALEATGLSFDSTWMMGLDDKAWPDNPKPNPFLPISLQKKHNMLRATTEREYYFARIMTNQFIQNSTNLIFSYSTQNQDGELQPSPLIKNYPAVENLKIKPKLKIIQQNFTTIPNDSAPNIQEHEALHASSDILEQQAACPFRAFTKHRLLAREIPEPLEGISSLERGSITHKALEIIWQQVKTHKKLCAITKNELNQIITTSIEKALTKKSEFAKLNNFDCMI